MRLSTKRSLIIDDGDLIKQQNEENLATVLQIYKLFGEAKTESAINEVRDPLCKVEYLKKNCPEGQQLRSFVTQAAPLFKYEYFQKGHVMFNYGEFGDKLYIILKGEVLVFIPRSNEDIQRDVDYAMTHKEQNFNALWKGKFPLITELGLHKNTNFVKENVPQLQKIFQFYSGQSFGDQALIADKPRSASIVVSSDEIHLISMQRHDYKIVCEKTISEMNQKTDYFMARFPANSKFTISKLQQYFKPIEFSTNTILWKEGEQAHFFFVIIKGRIEISKQIPEYILKGKTVTESTQFLQHHKKKKIILCQLSDNAFVGQQEIIDGTTRQTSCTVADITTAYYIAADEFNSIRKSYPEVVRQLREKCNQILKYTEARQTSIIGNFVSYEQQINGTNQPTKVIIERRTVDEIFKEDEKRPDMNHLRSYKPKNLTQTEITEQNIKVNEFKELTTDKGEFVLMDSKMIEDIRIRIQRQFGTQVVNKPKIKLSNVSQDQVLVSRIQSGLCKSRSRVKLIPQQSLTIRGSDTNPLDHFQSKISFTIPNSPLSQMYQRQTNKSRHQKMLFGSPRNFSSQEITLGDGGKRIHTAPSGKRK